MSWIQSSDGDKHITRCEVRECHARAEWVVSATWSIADFLDYELCSTHAILALEWLSNRTVDGQLPIGVEAHWITSLPGSAFTASGEPLWSDQGAPMS